MVAPQMAQHQVMSLIVHGMFDRYPELKVVMLESGVTWIFWLMWRLDQQFREFARGYTVGQAAAVRAYPG